ncbi:MAG: 2-C-methyl-D-erythritol 4-phosphate cytidylyltransferase [Clostridia bacterium]|nr:2-C-methyl-D-erythritol 4-phosphate cytidylyltransferase [Clostridia bacterium]
MSIISEVGRTVKEFADGSFLKSFTSAVILAAGSGTRMNSDKTKQWIQVGGVPAVVRTLAVFQASKYINEIIVCARADEIGMYASVKEEYGISKLKCVVPGGSTRQESALAGFKRISDKASLVAIHDAARCLITAEMIEATVRVARRDGGACAAQRATDTVKKVDRYMSIIETVDRETVWLAQTPQIFEVEQYRAAAYLAIRDGFKVTDDASLMEHAGFNVTMVDCGKENIKITEPVDLLFAEAVIKMRAER